MEFRNMQKQTVDRWHSDLPSAEALADLKVRDIVRLSLASGSFLWAEVVARSDGRKLVVRSLDRLPCDPVSIGDRFSTSIGAVFGVL